MLLNFHVGVTYKRRGYKERSSGGELNDKARVPQYKVTALCVVEISERGDGAEAKGEVRKVDVAIAHRLRAEVIGSRLKYARLEVTMEEWVLRMKFAQSVGVVVIKSGLPRCQHRCAGGGLAMRATTVGRHVHVVNFASRWNGFALLSLRAKSALC